MNWDEILVTLVSPDNFLITEDELAYSLHAEQRMIVFTGERGIDGTNGTDGASLNPVGEWTAGNEYQRLDLVSYLGSSYVALTEVPRGILVTDPTYWQMLTQKGSSGYWGEIQGNIEDQTDLQTELGTKLSDAPSDGEEYVRKDGSWVVSSGGGGASEWGNITGTLSNQTDLQDALNTKANTADLGTMSAINDAPSANVTYGRRNGRWKEVATDPTWGDITGTLSDQTDLQTALNAKANSADLGTMSSKNDAPSDTKTYGRKDGAWAEVVTDVSWGGIDGTLSDQTDLQTALDAKADEADLGTMSAEDDAPSDSKTYGRKNGAWSEVVSDVSWGDINGTLSDQTDLQDALDDKADVISTIMPTTLTSDTTVTIPANATVTSYKATYPPTQSGSGTPSSGNIRPFIAASSCYRNFGQGGSITSQGIALPQTIYGGEVDIINGVLTVTWGHIDSYRSSYAGWITEGWYSDRDDPETAEAPTDGAEVVYKLETPAVYPCSYGLVVPKVNNDMVLSATTASISGTYNYYTSVAEYIPQGATASNVDVKTYVDHQDEKKFDIANAGVMAYMDDAPSNGNEYVRKNGAWAVSSGGGGGGASAWGQITGTLSDQTDLQDALDVKANTSSLGTMASVNDAPSDGTQYARQNGAWTVVTGGGGGGSSVWGQITGTLSNQTDLQDALDVKANTSDLGTMASVNDAPSNGSEYVRKNGAWAVSSGGGGGGASAWGQITGTLSNQTDLQTALNAKADSNDLGTMASANRSDYYTQDATDRLLADKADTADLGTMSAENTTDYYTKTATDGLLADKANTSDLGDLSTLDSIDYTSNKITNKPTLGSLAALSSIDYTSGYLTNKPILGSLADQDTVDYATEVTNKPTLGDLSSMDTIDYTSNVLTNKPTLGAMAAESDAPSDGSEYVRKDGAWSPSSAVTSVRWGYIGGTLSNQTDLNTELTSLRVSVGNLQTGKVNVTGGTMTGDISVKSDNITSSAPESTVTGKGIYLTASNGDAVGGLFPQQNADGSVAIWAKTGYITSGGGASSAVKLIQSGPGAPRTSDFAFASDLGDLASANTIDYTSNKLTNKPTLGTMASVNDAPSNGSEYVRKNGAWAVSSGADALHISMPSTSSLGTISNAGIKTTMRVVNIVWGTPSNVTSDVSWNTDTAGQLVLSGTLSGATTAEIDLIDFA